jgi:hypothetical protein
MRSKEPEFPSAETILTAMEAAANYVAVATGLKKQFLDSGWSEEGAEHLTIQMLGTSING